jgi:phenylalanyl-tRNA synthetase beta chain
MRISLNWLQELVNITLSPEDLAQTLTIAGFEVEEIEDRRSWADGVVVGKVLSVEPHPNADKLRVCQVDIGQETPSNIVCGASNVRADAFVPVATLGSYLPAINLKLKKTKLRGVPSEGMICSLSELGLTKESDGIQIFSQENLTPGMDVRPLLGLDDVILDLTATANRADALSMVGVAREVTALTGGNLKLPQSKKPSIAGENPQVSLNIADSHACPAYIATVMEGVKIAPSPDWLQWRLTNAGVRPINNVVDITNYILLEWGQPLHAFDREKLSNLSQNKNINIGVRFAFHGESIKTLDGQDRTLQPQNLLITAQEHPIALAGVMGGEETEVDDLTKNIVLEAALFDPVAIRRSSRSQNLRTEASSRYERGVNYAEFELAVNRAIALLQEIAQGTPSSQAIVDHRSIPGSRSLIELRLERVNQVLGKVKRNDTIGDILAEDVERILGALGCELKPVKDKDHVWKVKVPPYRYRDLEREIDLIEEIARLYGYDHFCDTLPNKTAAGYLSFPEIVRRQLRSAFRAVGLTELVQYSLVKPEQADLVIANPLFSEYSALRRDLISGLIDAFIYNQDQGNGALNGFEIGRIFWKEEDNFLEADLIGGIFGGDYFPKGSWTKAGKSQPLTWYEAKGILETVFNSFDLKVTYEANSKDTRFHPGRTASLTLDGKNLGIFGQLHPLLCKQKDLPDQVYVFEISFDLILESLSQTKSLISHFKPYSTYPAVERDLAFFVEKNISVADLEANMIKTGSNLLAKVELFDQYQGKNVPEGQRSLAFSLIYRSLDRTLTDEDIEPIHQKIRDNLVKEFEVILRS